MRMMIPLQELRRIKPPRPNLKWGNTHQASVLEADAPGRRRKTKMQNIPTGLVASFIAAAFFKGRSCYLSKLSFTVLSNAYGMVPLSAASAERPMTSRFSHIGLSVRPDAVVRFYTGVLGFYTIMALTEITEDDSDIGNVLGCFR
jgi:hypothetical protein